MPEPQVISDPRRPRLRLFSLWEFNPRDALVGETGIVAPDGRWFRQMDASQPADSLNSYTRDNWGIILPLEADSVPAKLTENPRIVNLSEIELAIRDAYPTGLRDAGIGGTVAIHFLVTESGEVERIRLGQISAYAAINEAALAVAEVYRFSPARVDQEPVPVWVSHAISFYPPR
jgi:TonB family protein